MALSVNGSSRGRRFFQVDAAHLVYTANAVTRNEQLTSCRITRVLAAEINMLRSSALVCVLLATAMPTGAAQDRESENEIRRIVAEQAAAWNAGDGEAYAEHVAPDSSFTNIFGMVMYGRQAFVKRHAEILATFYKGTTKHHSVRRIRFITPDVALVDIDNEVRGVKAMPGGAIVPAGGVVKTQLMEVFVRREGRWWVEAYHNVDVKPAR